MNKTRNGKHRGAALARGWGLALCMGCLGIGSALAQVSEEQRAARQEQQRRIAAARMLEANKRQIAAYDLDGNELGTIGEPDMYGAPVFSPDRSRIAAIRSSPQLPDVPQSSDIFILDVETGEASRLTMSEPGEGPGSPVWSPDGRELAFSALRGSRYNIYRRPVDGKGESELVYSHDGEPIMVGDWSPDGRYLAFSSSAIASEGRLYMIDLESDGEPVVVAEADHPMIMPRFSPDGRYLAYLSITETRVDHYVTPVQTGRQETWRLSANGTSSFGFWDVDDPLFYHIDNERRLMAISVDTSGDSFELGEERRIVTLPDTVPANNVLDLFSMSRDGERLLFSLPPRPQPQQIAVLDRKGREITRLGEPDFYDLPSFSPDGSRILAQRVAEGGVGGGVLWTFDLASGKAAEVSEAPPGFWQSAVWMADGENVAYSTLPLAPAFGDYSWVYRKRADGEGEAEALYRSTTGVLLTLMDVSPERDYLMFDSFGWVATVPLAGGDPLAREAIDLLRAEFEASAPRFSPDMRFVAYIYNESGRPEVYLAPFDGETGTASRREPHEVSEDGAAGALDWREDGRELYYLSEMLDTPELNDFRVMAVSVTPEPALETGEPRTLFEITLPATITTAQITPAGVGSLPLWQNVSQDGQRFVFVLPASSGE